VDVHVVDVPCRAHRVRDIRSRRRSRSIASGSRRRAPHAPAAQPCCPRKMPRVGLCKLHGQRWPFEYPKRSGCRLRVTSVILSDRRRPANFRYAPLATEVVWRCNRSRWANRRHHQNSGPRPPRTKEPPRGSVAGIAPNARVLCRDITM
jgi:hypothetical protein